MHPFSPSSALLHSDISPPLLAIGQLRETDTMVDDSGRVVRRMTKREVRIRVSEVVLQLITPSRLGHASFLCVFQIILTGFIILILIIIGLVLYFALKPSKKDSA